MDTRDSRHTHRGSVSRALALLAALSVLPAALSGCSSSGASTPTPKPAAVAGESPKPEPSPSPTPTPTPTEVPIPTSCESAYTPELLASLQATHPPLNDASMVDGTFSDIERLDNTIRAGSPLVCTWGVAGPIGIVTAVSRLTEEQSMAAQTAMQEGGFTCTPAGDAVTCVFSREGDRGFVVGESHYLRGTIAVSTRWINASIDGYTEGMVAAIWK
ncbi:hypothetical protein ACLRGF_04445 [Mycetocola zhadangensis]|uniref:hypothetical protein n=1 Tax=Mycetocola zhadangensis TaxID=1164595 RepID=UPI003A4D7A3C